MLNVDTVKFLDQVELKKCPAAVVSSQPQQSVSNQNFCACDKYFCARDKFFQTVSPLPLLVTARNALLLAVGARPTLDLLTQTCALAQFQDSFFCSKWSIAWSWPLFLLKKKKKKREKASDILSPQNFLICLFWPFYFNFCLFLLCLYRTRANTCSVEERRVLLKTLITLCLLPT